MAEPTPLHWSCCGWSGLCSCRGQTCAASAQCKVPDQGLLGSFLQGQELRGVSGKGVVSGDRGVFPVALEQTFGGKSGDEAFLLRPAERSRF